MEEADALCHRIGIITDGTLRTIGIQQKLKRIYGKGYHLSVNIEIERAVLFESLTKRSGSLQEMEEEDEKPQSILSE